MSTYNGTLQVLNMDGTVLAKLTSVDITLDTNLFEVTSKESGGYAEFLPGLRNITYSVEGIADFQSANKDLADIFTAYTSRASVALVWTNAVTGDKKISQTAYISSCSISAPMEETVTYSIEFQGTGTPTIATI